LNVAAGGIVQNMSGILFSFPYDDSPASAFARIQAAIDTLQSSMNCPIESSTFAVRTFVCRITWYSIISLFSLSATPS
jgi:hypothetical protein